MLYTHSIEKLLGLKGVIVKNVRQLPDKTDIFIELPQKPHVCPCCGHQTSYVHDYRGRGVRTKSWTEYTQEGDRGCIQRNNIAKPWRFMKKRNR
ncbi:MAG: hypothetical protein ACFWUC_06625 [Oscillospiraceae bacterium]|jgi:transposase